ncbi:unnamed protein product [Adineta steineri]|uniref:Multifunctional fusion protein n=2 Tax=Adineta steineri TaxID=433720 RepID=A0A813WIG7_9BILA|nr:unnamed protein product [Adineta steineri]
MDTKHSKQNFNSSHGVTVSYVRQPRQRITENYLLLWVDKGIDQANEGYETTLKQIRTITGDVNAFTQRDACIDFLTDAQEDTKYFLVVRDTMSQQIMLLINDIPQLDSVYIFNDIETLHDQCAKKCDKIKSIHTNIDDLCKALQIDIKQFNQDSIAMSFNTDILLDMQHGEQAIEDFITYCRDHDCFSSTNINRFEKQYNAQTVIWWYTFPSNIYSMLNYALRTLDADAIITMGFFMCHLHQQIQQLYEQQLSTYDEETFIVYRGQGLMKSDFEKLQKTNGGLMSFNNFLSTSTDKEVSLEFAQCASTKPDTIGILFIMSIDPCIKSTPFASIKEKSYFKEENEILFSMHTVFRVVAIKQMDNKNQLYQVELQLTSDDDQQLRLLTDRIRKEGGRGTGWHRLGTLLLRIGQFNEAEELYNVLLEQTSDEGEKALYYNQVGFVHSTQSDYKKAIWYYEQGLKIREKTLPSNHLALAISYNNFGGVYERMAEYSKALSYYEKALEIDQKTLPSNHPSLATSYSNIGTVYNSMVEYAKALLYFEKALEIKQKTLPSNHPDLATLYNNIGLVYENMREYSKALSSHEKSLEICQKTLPSNHPHLASSYNNIGSLYGSMGEYLKALSCYEKALELRQQIFPSNHPSLAASYNNIGFVYENMKDYSKALSYFERALDLWQRALPPTHRYIKSVKERIAILRKKL